MLQRCQTHPFDSQLISQLKARLKAALHDKFPVTVTHKLALFLHPQYKSLRKITLDERQAVLQMARDYVKVLKDNDLLLSQSESLTSNRLEIHSFSSLRAVSNYEELKDCKTAIVALIYCIVYINIYYYCEHSSRTYFHKLSTD